MDNNQIYAITDDGNANENACGVMELRQARNTRAFLIDAKEVEKYVSKKEDLRDVLTNIFTNYIYAREPGFIDGKSFFLIVARIKDTGAYVIYFKLVSRICFSRITKQGLIRGFDRYMSRFSDRPIPVTDEIEAFRKEYDKWLLKGKNMGFMDECIHRKLI